MAQKPPTQKEVLDQLWYAVIGTNGDGLLGRMTKLEDKCALRNGKKPMRLEILTGIMALMLGLQTLGLLDGIRAMVYGWLSG